MKIEGHPILPAPTLPLIEAEQRRSGGTLQEAADRLLRLRAEVLEAEELDPVRNGWEPDVWKVCDALIDFPVCLDRGFLKRLRRYWEGTRTEAAPEDAGLWEWFKGEMRVCLGWQTPVRMLLILGGNRSSKSEYAAKRGVQMLMAKAQANVAFFHMSNPRSIRDQQPTVWRYLPPEWRVQRATADEYIKYKRKTGFSEGSFITPNGSEAFFGNYMQDRSTALEGLEQDLMLPDELVPVDWIETLELRLATRGGKAVVTFTPVNGYTPTVALFCDQAKVVRSRPAFLLPRDGGKPDEAAALGLSEEEYGEIRRAAAKRRPARAPESRPEDCLKWLAAGGRGLGEEGRQTPDAGRRPPEGRRVFEQMPRVLRSVDPKKAVVFFYSDDNPYGNPKEVIDTVRPKAAVFVRERFYGRAEKTVSNLFPRFGRVHIVRARAIPAEGTNYMFMDPASGRNAFLSWFRVCMEGGRVRRYLYREWPGKYEIPGIGVPGPWAVPSGKRDGINDGARGEGQGPWGFGKLRMKFEVARLEGWEHYEAWRKENGDKYPPDEELMEWNEEAGAREPIEGRAMDSRAASAPRVENDRPTTLLTEYDEIGFRFGLAPGGDIADGVNAINSWLDYEDGTNEPAFYVCEECENSIYALSSWKHVDGEKGACKDPVDNIRYFAMSDCECLVGARVGVRGGFDYGTAGRNEPRHRERNRAPWAGRR